MTLREVPRLLWQAVLAGTSEEGLCLLAQPDGTLVLQATTERPLPIPREAARDLAVALLDELEPGLTAQLETASRRASLRVVGGDGGEAA
jgi:hypothetical protein